MSEQTNTGDSHQPLPAPFPSMEEWEAKDHDYRHRANELLSGNKTVLFNALSAAGITTVVVSFDGYGDSGQIEQIEVKIGDEPGELPDERIEILDPVWGSPGIERQTHTICEAIEAMAYAFLRQTHEGWENNDGGFGDFTFDVAERSISLDYNERYTETNSYNHEF